MPPGGSRRVADTPVGAGGAAQGCGRSDAAAWRRTPVTALRQARSMSWPAFCISSCPRGTTLGMNGQEHGGKAGESAAAAHQPLAPEDDQDTAAAWAAVAAWAIT